MLEPCPSQSLGAVEKRFLVLEAAVANATSAKQAKAPPAKAASLEAQLAKLQGGRSGVELLGGSW